MLKSETLAKNIIATLENHKAQQITKIDLRKIENCFCSFFVICHGTSGTHIAGLTDYIEEEIKEKLGDTPFHTERLNSSQWAVLDYGDVVVHIFDKESRDHYQLEEFWGDGILETIETME